MDFEALAKEAETISATEYINAVQAAIDSLNIAGRVSSSLTVTGKLAKIKPKGQAVVVGDLHGDLASLGEILDGSHFLERAEKAKDDKIVFLGDYGDRGVKSPEVLYSVCKLKVMFPKQVVLLRGNHEGPQSLMAEPHDLPLFLKRRFGERWQTAYQKTQQLFNSLLNGAYVEDRYLMVHGGIPAQLRNLQEIADADQLYPKQPILEQLLWSDPEETFEGAVPSPRGAGSIFGKDVTQKALDAVKAKILIRGHEPVEGGYKINHDGRVLTLFSRCGSPYFNDSGAYLDLPLAEKFERAEQLKSYLHQI